MNLEFRKAMENCTRSARGLHREVPDYCLLGCVYGYYIFEAVLRTIRAGVQGILGKRATC